MLVSEPESACLTADFMIQIRLLGQFKAVIGKYTQLRDSDSKSSGQEEY
jgi:hypothetical protein